MTEGRKIVVRFTNAPEGSNGSRRSIVKPFSRNSASPGCCQWCRYDELDCAANS